MVRANAAASPTFDILSNSAWNASFRRLSKNISKGHARALLRRKTGTLEYKQIMTANFVSFDHQYLGPFVRRKGGNSRCEFIENAPGGPYICLSIIMRSDKKFWRELVSRHTPKEQGVEKRARNSH
jgi:hypothetical protein